MAILIADSGSSKIDWRIIEKNNKISQIKTLGINPFYQDEQSIFELLTNEVAPKISVEISEIYYYGAGITQDSMENMVRNPLQKIFKNAKIEINDDLIGAARALCLHDAGIACILGTGSNSCVYNGVKIIEKEPTLGFWLGDEGSGGYLGKELIKKYIKIELPLEIFEKFIKKFGNLERLEILENAYKKPYPNRYFAGFSKFLFDNRSNAFIYKLVYDAFCVFFETTILKYQDYQQMKVHFTGSVAFYYSDILKKAAKNYNITIGVIMESPIAGLVLFHK